MNVVSVRLRHSRPAYVRWLSTAWPVPPHVPPPSSVSAWTQPLLGSVQVSAGYPVVQAPEWPFWLVTVPEYAAMGVVPKP